MKIANLKIGTRLAAAFGMVLALTALMTIVGVSRLEMVNAATEEMDDAAVKQQQSQEWLSAISANSVRTFAKAKSADLTDQAYFQTEMDATSAAMTTAQKSLEERIKTDGGTRLLATIAEKRKAYVAIRKEVFGFKAAMKLGDEAELKNRIDRTLVPAMNAYVGSVQDLVAFQKEIFRKARADAGTVYVSGRAFLIGLGLVAFALGCVLAWLLSRSITR